MEDNPLFVDQIRNAVAKLRENRTTPMTPYAKPTLHTWASHVAWERLRYLYLQRAVWAWLDQVDENIETGTDDLKAILNSLNCTRPEEN